MLLAIDAGNSFVKLAYHDGLRWGGRESIALGEFEASARPLAGLPRPDNIIIANVAAEKFSKPMRAVLEEWGKQALWVSAQASGYGLNNAYAEPAQLGVDRWVAMIGARRKTDSDVVVVSVGTAVTIDFLSSQGVFSGGVILPGQTLMRACLSEKTQGIGRVAGHYDKLPKSTADAVYSGTLNAVAGALEKTISAMTGSLDGGELMLTGGGAAEVVPILGRSCRLEPDLVLEGLLHIASEEGMR